jgi:acetylornithine deacetylase/succinyl-diaminopimelate desuccinylase-like protein
LTLNAFCTIIRINYPARLHHTPLESPTKNQSSPIYERPAEILQNLIRFDTTNPPGNERACIEYIDSLLKDAGIQTNMVARTPERPNLIARLKGAGNAPPLLLYGHVDVVSTQGQRWTHPPFEARLVDGYIWGRGALDMKHGIAMYLAAILKAKAEGTAPAGDLIFAATVDEEANCENGAKYLVEEHAALFENVHYALSEFGGSSINISGKLFYPIQTSEKLVCPTRVTFHGTGGHGAVPVHGGAMAKLAAALIALDRHQLPVHVTPQTRLMVQAIADGLGGLPGLIVRQMLNPLFTNFILKLLGSTGNTFSPLLHNSVSPTILKASEDRNVIPSEVSLILDGRILPGFSASDLEAELQNLLGKECTIKSDLSFPGPPTTDMGLFETLASTLKELDPLGIPFPFVNYAFTDARFFSKIGIQTYGFTPLLFNEGLDLTSTIHGADERVPVAALDFGVKAVSRLLQKYTGEIT